MHKIMLLVGLALLTASCAVDIRKDGMSIGWGALKPAPVTTPRSEEKEDVSSSRPEPTDNEIGWIPKPAERKRSGVPTKQEPQLQAPASHPSERLSDRGVPTENASDRDVVVEIQQHLGLKADGKFGPQTEKAIRSWQRENGLPETGKPTSELLARLKQKPAENKEVEKKAPPQEKQKEVVIELK